MERIETALDFLYSREYRGRGVREMRSPGTLDPSQLTLPQWIAEVREWFPQDTVEIIEKHALDRYQLTELLADREVLEKLEPNVDLLKSLMTFRGHLDDSVLATARRIIQRVVDDLRSRLELDVRRSLSGRLNKLHHGRHPSRNAFDALGTIRKNLRHYDPKRRRLIPNDLRFFARNNRHLPWHVVLCVDQSGSMGESVIHSAVMAGILCGLPLLKVSLVLFDTEVVDLSGHAHDPVDVLMSVQLGGGTDIGKALGYTESLIENPRRTVVILVSDFCEGGSPAALIQTCRRILEGGVTLLGLASLDQAAKPAYDREMAGQLADAGMEIAALTPNRLAEWLARIIHSR
jgi:Mg-chelatase subunit ChlD